MYSLFTRAWRGEGSSSSSTPLVMCHLPKCFTRGRDSIFILYNYKWVLILLNIAMKFDSSDYSLTCNLLYFGFQTFFPGSPFPPQHSVYSIHPAHLFNIGILLGSTLDQVLTQPSIPRSHVNSFEHLHVVNSQIISLSLLLSMRLYF